MILMNFKDCDLSTSSSSHSLFCCRCHNVCKVFGWCHDSRDGSLCVVMKRYQQNLCSKLQGSPGGRLSLKETQNFGRQICMAVAELHAQGVVVADLKPQNLLLDGYDNCVVADFGISTILSHGHEHNLSEGLHGTFNYMSPEAFDPETYGGVTTETDAWSFACCVVEMVSGKRPWDGTSMSAICYKVCSGKVPTVPVCLPRRIRDALSACFSHDRNARPRFHQLFSVFDEPWDISTPMPPVGTQHLEVEQLLGRVRGMEKDKIVWERERSEMQKFILADASRIKGQEAELEQARAERSEMQKFIQADASRIKGQEAELEQARAVCKQLQDQLQLLVSSFKEQHSQGGAPFSAGCSSCSRNAELRQQVIHCWKSSIAPRMLICVMRCLGSNEHEFTIAMNRSLFMTIPDPMGRVRKGR